MTNLEKKQPHRPKLSIVVIAYNNELFIEEALESLHEQTFDDYEVVVVNDFSSDDTGKIIDGFVEGKSKFKAIHLKENSGGCSTPRNTGIANTTGEYVMFLDGDDWYTPDACEKMVAGIERTQSDFVAGQVIRTNNYEIWYHKQIYNREHNNINIREFTMLLFDSLSVNKIYKREFLDRNSLRFPEGIHYEDIVFTGKAYFLAESISIIPEPVYYWRVLEDAEVKSITNQRSDFKNFENRIIAHRFFDQFLKNNHDMIYTAHKNNKFLRHDLKLYTNDYLLFDREYRDKFHDLIHEYLNESMDKYTFLKLPEKERIMYYLLFIGDRNGFEDFIRYKEGLPTVNRRIYYNGEKYFFKSTFSGNHDKFLQISNIEINYKIDKIHLTNDSLVFSPQVVVNSVENEDINIYWRLRNWLTGDSVYADEVGGTVTFDLSKLEPGNHYLSFYVNYLGDVHKTNVKRTEIENLQNIRVEDNRIEKKIFINRNNSFAIKVSPVRSIDKLKWSILKRQKNSSYSRGKIKTTLVNLLRSGIRRLPVKHNWVLFESHMGKQFSDSPKYIYMDMLNKGMKYKYIWSFEQPESNDLPAKTIKVKRNSLKHFYYLNRSKYWIDNQGIAHLADKKDNQVYLQTWHGTPLKKMGFDQKTKTSKAQISKLNLQTQSWDYFVSPNEYSSRIFKRAFRYTGEILNTGYPRNDLLINQPRNVIEKVYTKLNLSPKKKVVLYAPTFRDWDSNSYRRVLNDIKTISEGVDNDTVILLRLHYLLSDKLSYTSLPSNALDVSQYPDVQELYLITDLLITDYSSVMFDFALMERPIIMYCYDLEDYVSRRGLYFDITEKSPGPVCHSVEDVISILNSEDSLMKCKEMVGSFNKEMGNFEDGNASSKIVNYVFR